MINITHVISDTNVGGAGILLAYITEALRDAFDFTVVLPTASALAVRLPRGVRVTPLPFSPDRSLNVREIGLFARYFAKVRPDIVHTHAALSARLGAMRCGIQTRLSTRHCTGFSRRHGVLSPLYAYVYNRATTLTVATAEAARRELTGEGVDPMRIVTLRNGVPERHTVTEAQRHAARLALGITDGDIVLGMCARLAEVKGHDLLLRAAAQLYPAFPRLRLLFVGEGQQKDALIALSALLGIRHIVHFTGYTDDPTVYQSLFTVNINASRGTETSCLATSECMSLGIPTVASDVGGNAEMIQNGESGYLFPLEDAHALAAILARLLRAPEELRRLGRGARRVYERDFSLERMAGEYERLYLDLFYRKNGK